MDMRKEIERTAYELYEKGGCIPGHEMDHWLEAEKIVNSRRSGASSFKLKDSAPKKTGAKPAEKGVKKLSADSKKAKAKSKK